MFAFECENDLAEGFMCVVWWGVVQVIVMCIVGCGVDYDDRVREIASLNVF